MNTDHRLRGFSLIEVMASLALLSVAALGMVAGMLVASGSTVISRKRTDMALFAQARLERLASRTRLKIPTAATVTPVDCSSMTVGGAFDPNTDPNTGGWMLDVIDGAPPAGGGTYGDDLMAGPLLAETDSGPDATNTLSKRTSFAGKWIDGSDRQGCASAVVRNDTSVLCREIHIEPVNVTNAGVTTFMLRVWVRVIQGGVPWQSANLVLRQDVAQ
jgi:prepilin-type N-terminal cleavage/methylation domain-containing protein